MRNWSAMFLVFTLVACGSSDSGPSEGDKACQDLQAKYQQCQLTPAGACDPSDVCAVRCMANASCAELQSPSPMGSYQACIAACSGAGPNDVFCADGKTPVPKTQICDGQRQCPDGSDETGCGLDAGR